MRGGRERVAARYYAFRSVQLVASPIQGATSLTPACLPAVMCVLNSLRLYSRGIHVHTNCT